MRENDALKCCVNGGKKTLAKNASDTLTVAELFHIFTFTLLFIRCQMSDCVCLFFLWVFCKQTANQPIAWQQLTLFWHVDVVKTTYGAEGIGGEIANFPRLLGLEFEVEWF